MDLKDVGKVTLKEIFYYLFFSLLLFAKGIGLYDGQKMFKLFLIAAVLFWILKMLVTEYTVREFIVCLIAVLLGGVVYLSSGEKAALVAMMVIVGMKDIPVKRLFKVGLTIWTICFAGALILSFTGIITPLMLVHNKAGLGYVIRNSLGYPHPNVLHISYLILLAFAFQVFDFKGKNARWAVGIAFVGNIYIFLYSLSYTGIIITTAFLIFVLYFTQRRKVSKAENVIIQCLMPICVIFSLVLPISLKGKLFELANKIFNSRIELSRYYLRWNNISLFGTPIDMGEKSIDCSYVYCLIYYGVILFLILMIGYFLLIKNLLKEKKMMELALVLGLVAAGFTEPFQFNFSFKNLILPFLGEYLFMVIQGNRCDNSIGLKKIWKVPCFLNKNILFRKREFKVNSSNAQKNRWAALLILIIGLVLGSVLGSQIAVPSYVIVNKDNSDRIGEKGDYDIFGEISAEIRSNSIQINCYDAENEVYILEGNIIKLEKVRNIVTCSIMGVILLLFIYRIALYIKGV